MRRQRSSVAGILGLATLLAPAVALLAAAPPLPDLSGAESRVATKITALHQAVASNQRDDEAWGRYGMTLDAHRYAEAAGTAYRRAAELDPRDFRWPYFLGALYENEAPVDAARWLETALAIDGTYAPAHIRLARTLEALDRRDQALEQYRTATRLAPDDPMGYLGAGRIRLATGDAPGAIVLLEQARDRGPGIQAVVATLARAYQRAGDAARARSLATEARDLPRMMHHLDPRHAAVGAEAVDRESYLRRARTDVETGQVERARGELAELLRLGPDDAEGWLALADVHDRLGRGEEAIAAARRALAIDPALRGGQAALANALFAAGRVVEAEATARVVLETEPDNTRLHVLSSMAAAARGDVAAVTAHLDRAYQIGTTDRELRSVMRSLLGELAGALAEVGSKSEAARRWEQVLRLAEEDGESAAARSELEARIEQLRR